MYKDGTDAQDQVKYTLYCADPGGDQKKTDETLRRMSYVEVSYRDSEYMSRTFSLRSTSKKDDSIDKHNEISFAVTEPNQYLAPIIAGSTLKPDDLSAFSPEKEYWYLSFPWTDFLKSFRAARNGKTYKLLTGARTYQYQLYVVDPVTKENIGDPIKTLTFSSEDMLTGQIGITSNAKYRRDGKIQCNGLYLYDKWQAGCEYRIRLTIGEYLDVGTPMEGSVDSTLNRKIFHAHSSTSLLMQVTPDQQTAFTPVQYTDTNLGVGDVAEVDFYNARLGRVDVYGEKVFSVNYDWRVMMGSTPNLKTDLSLAYTPRYVVSGGGQRIPIRGHLYDQVRVDEMVEYEGYDGGFLGEFDEVKKAPVSKYPYWSSTDRLEIPDYVPDPDDPTQNYKDASGNPVAVAGKKIYCNVTYGLCSARWSKAYKELPIYDMYLTKARVQGLKDPLEMEEQNYADLITPRDLKSWQTAPVTVKAEPQGAKLKDTEVIGKGVSSDGYTLQPGDSMRVHSNSTTLRYLNPEYYAKLVGNMITLLPELQRLQRTNPQRYKSIFDGFKALELFYYLKDSILNMPASVDLLAKFAVAWEEADKETARISFADYQWQKWDESKQEWVDMPGETKAWIDLNNLQTSMKIRCKEIVHQYLVIDGKRVTRGDVQDALVFFRLGRGSLSDEEAKELYPGEPVTMYDREITINVHDTGVMNVGSTNLDYVANSTSGYDNGSLQTDHWTYDKYSHTLRLEDYVHSLDYGYRNGLAYVWNSSDEEGLVIDLMGENKVTIDLSQLPAETTEVALIKAKKSITFTGSGNLTLNVIAPAGTLKKLSFMQSDKVRMYCKGKVVMNLQNADFPAAATVKYLNAGHLEDAAGTLAASAKTLPATAANCAFISTGTSTAATVEVMNSDTRGLTLYEGADAASAQTLPESEAKLIARILTPLNVKYRAATITVAHKHAWAAEQITKHATLTETGIACIHCVNPINAGTDNEHPCPEKRETVIPIFGVYGALAEPTGSNQITVTWDATLEAETYEVYRYSDTKKDFVKIGAVKVEDGKTAPTYSYVDKDLAAGVKYRYKVRCIRTGDYALTSNLCNEVSATAYIIPATPVGVSAAPTGNGKITVKWNASQFATLYTVWRYYDDYATVVGTVEANSATPTQFTDSGLTEGKTYEYAVTAGIKVDGQENPLYSDPSQKVSAVAYALKTPENVQAKPSDTVRAVTITWNQVPNANGFIIYRATGDSNKFDKVGQIGVSGQITETFTDTSVAGLTNYTYKVSALRNVPGGVVESDLSAPVLAYVNNNTPAPGVTDLGDVDADGKVSSSDARLALRQAVDLENYAASSAEFKACDVDLSGTVTSGDARLILRRAVGFTDPEWGVKAN